MTDIHCHILSNIDDGAKSLKESLQMASLAYSSGTRRIIATPHMNPERRNWDEFLPARENRIEELREALKKFEINVEIKGGAEIKFTYEMYKSTHLKYITLGGSEYLLVELRQNEIPLWFEAELYNLRMKGYTPVIAHAERINNLKSKLSLINSVVEQGVLIQVNSDNFSGGFFDKFASNLRLLAKNNLIHTVGSDAHNILDRKPLLKPKTAPDFFNELLENNDKIWKNISIF